MDFTRTCVEWGLCLYEHEWELLNGMCGSCYNKYFKITRGNGCKNSDEIIRDYYRNEFEREINK